mmetsp:Transcript_165/g.339  ORF Transcript_165/g.339 Transcript_165/m.339 type:complete len:232 (-) Transcript_165:59-754(-)
MHGGGPPVTAGAPLAHEYKTENLDLLHAGCANLGHHIKNLKKFGVHVVVAINQFATDTEKELAQLKEYCLTTGADAACVSNHWALGGAGAAELAEAIAQTCAKPKPEFKFLYPLEASIKEKVETVAREIYGADGVEWSEEAEEKVARYTRQGFANLPVCIAKTHLSLSADPSKRGVPTGFKIPVRDVRASAGAGFVYPLIGSMSTMPGLPTRPCYYEIDIDPETGKITGLS